MNRPYGNSEQAGDRRSIRLQDFDYSQVGGYFVTTCTHDRACLFGNVVVGQMQLNEAGRIVETVWQGSGKSYDDIDLDAFVVMPNHVHGIIVICGPVGAIHESPLRSDSSPKSRTVERRRMLLSKIIGRFKMVSAKKINVLRNTPGVEVWQRNYYEHVIRNEDSLRQIQQYIVDNPAQWDFDRENPAASAQERRGDS